MSYFSSILPFSAGWMENKSWKRNVFLPVSQRGCSSLKYLYFIFINLNQNSNSANRGIIVISIGRFISGMKYVYLFEKQEEGRKGGVEKVDWYILKYLSRHIFTLATNGEECFTSAYLYLIPTRIFAGALTNMSVERG